MLQAHSLYFSKRMLKLMVVFFMLFAFSLPFQTTIFAFNGFQNSEVWICDTTADELPNSPGIEIAREKCLACHEADLIVQQRLDRAGWKREVGKMVRWGTQLTEAETETLTDYLALHFGKTKQPEPAPLVEKGAAVFQEKCLTCHEVDLTEQQRLTRVGWEREVNKMVRWGAPVTDTEKPALIEFLTKKYGPR